MANHRHRIVSPLPAGLAAAAAALLLVTPGALARPRPPTGTVLVGYRTPAALRAALARYPAQLMRNLSALRVAEVRPDGSQAGFIARVERLPGVRYAERPRGRRSAVEPALSSSSMPGGGVYEWQYAATHENAVPPAVLRAAAAVTIAVVDTGADLTAPDLAAKSPAAYEVGTGSTDVRDVHGHGTFVAALAAGSVVNGEGIAGFGGQARLLVVKASRSPDGNITDADEAAGIVYAVDHGAQIVNFSFSGPETSSVERSAVEYAASHGVLLVVAAGNEGEKSALQYPAALLQPLGSNGRGGIGLAVAASNRAGGRAGFSSVGSFVSLAAPGEFVASAVSSTAPRSKFPAFPLAGARDGLYGFGSGTSFAAPEVAGAAALVWAANPKLTAGQVAQILKETASGGAAWSPQLGYGVIDVAAAVERASNGTRPRRR